MSQQRTRPLDGVLDFESVETDVLTDSNEIKLEAVGQFEKLPIAGWHDQNQVLDSKCRQSCVKDCSCVVHCSFLIA